MDILNVLIQLRNDIIEWVTNNLRVKVDKEKGKGLSTNDFTNEYKENINNLNKLVGDTKVSEQIEKTQAVSYGKSQDLTLEQQAQARENIGAATESYVTNAVAQKSQVQIITWGADD